MHDLIQGMGKEIVRRQSPKEPEKRSRLWFNEDIISILEENKGTEKIEAINLDMLGDKEVKWDGMAFKKMSNLMMLIIRNARFSTSPKYLPSSLKVLDWKGYPYSHLPCHFNPKQLVILRMPESCFMLTESLKMFQSLCVMDFRGCQRVKRIPDLSEVPNLNELWLEGCKDLISVHPSVGFLGKLKRLSVKNCRKLRTFPSIWLRSLEHFDLSECESLQKFPEILGTMENLREINLNYSGIEELPLSFKNLAGLQKLELTRCLRLQEVRGISPNIKELELVNVNWYSHLSSESRKILLNQALHEIDGLKITIEEDRTPEWLDHCTEGDSVSFWIRKQFPNMAVFCCINCGPISRPA
ncbi:disease resistance protein RUN1-like [Prosopis cineraria]|uniref:disease resistance protein RUN1-like n=1 Tax=Prosopis cineraria TaxID=364024 RepID=UPI0024105494|nr:disease resistance protein RUN1-like [Prosopis cineraria]